MPRKKLPESVKRVKQSITLPRALVDLLNAQDLTKSVIIEKAVIQYLRSKGAIHGQKIAHVDWD